MEHEAAHRIFYSELWPHAATLLRMALFLTHHQSEAEDIVQESMLKAFRSIASFQEGTDAKGWLLTILRNTWRDRLRAGNSRIETTSIEQMDSQPIAPAENGDASWTKPQDILDGFSDKDIIAALQYIPDEIRWTLLLVDVEGMDHAQAATVLDIPVGTIKSRAHRGRGMLRAALLPRARQMGLVTSDERTADREVTS